VDGLGAQTRQAGGTQPLAAGGLEHQLHHHARPDSRSLPLCHHVGRGHEVAARQRPATGREDRPPAQPGCIQLAHSTRRSRLFDPAAADRTQPAGHFQHLTVPTHLLRPSRAGSLCFRSQRPVSGSVWRRFLYRQRDLRHRLPAPDDGWSHSSEHDPQSRPLGGVLCPLRAGQRCELR